MSNTIYPTRTEIFLMRNKFLVFLLILLQAKWRETFNYISLDQIMNNKQIKKNSYEEIKAILSRCKVQFSRITASYYQTILFSFKRSTGD